MIMAEREDAHSHILIKLSVWIFLLLILAVIALSYIFGVVVEPGYIGVRQITVALPLGPKQGFSDVGLTSGYHWNIPFYSRILFIPKTLQIIHIHRDTSLYPESEGALEVQTTDGSSVLVDISVVFRYLEAPGTTTVGEKIYSHGGPADLLKGLGSSQKMWRNTVRKVSIDELRRALGRLSTSEFYIPQKRQDEIKEAKANINSKLLKFGIKVESVLLRR
ncbi:MAG: hypothetical protein D6808_05345, partial [Candidatus Dadabacteria bacterium]